MIEKKVFFDTIVFYQRKAEIRRVLFQLFLSAFHFEGTKKAYEKA